MIRRAIVLAAGRGTRLGSLTARRPKPLIPVAGRPIIERVLAGLAGAGITDAAVVVGYRGAMLERHLGDGSGLGLRLAFFRQETLDGTAHALALARTWAGGERFFFGWGDILVPADNYARVLTAATAGESVLAVNEVVDPTAGAAVYIGDDGLVRRIVEKPPPGTSSTRWNNAGLGVLGPEVWDAIDALRPSARGEFELPQAIAALIDAGVPFRAVPIDGPWFDIGTPESLASARVAFRGLRP